MLYTSEETDCYVLIIFSVREISITKFKRITEITKLSKIVISKKSLSCLMKSEAAIVRKKLLTLKESKRQKKSKLQSQFYFKIATLNETIKQSM